MDIGSAKVDTASRDAIPHHLIDIADVTQLYNAGDHHDDSIRAIEVMHWTFAQMIAAICVFCHTLKKS